MHIEWIHHVHVDSKNYALLQSFITDHGSQIVHHGVGFLGKVYMIYAAENLEEALKKSGFSCQTVAFPPNARPD